jgi:hypothetical protein
MSGKVSDLLYYKTKDGSYVNDLKLPELGDRDADATGSGKR